jgi:hypothetical protein
MSAITIKGSNYSLDDAIVEFFGVRGRGRGHDSWGINVRSSRIDLEIDAGATSGWIQERVRHAIDATTGGQATRLRLGPRSAVFFFLGGGMTSDDLARATERGDLVEIPGVSVAGRTLTVQVVPEPRYEVTTSMTS